MKDLEYFKNKTPPSWSLKIKQGIKGGRQAQLAYEVGKITFLEGKASVILEGQVFWGEKIQFPEDHSYVIVDGDKIELPNKIEQKQEVKSNVAHHPRTPPVVTTTTFFNMPPSYVQSQNSTAVPPMDCSTNFCEAPSSSFQSASTGQQYEVVGIDDSFHPKGITFNVSVVGHWGPNGFKPRRTGTVTFNSGLVIPIEEYDQLTKEERIERNDQDFNSPSVYKY